MWLVVLVISTEGRNNACQQPHDFCQIYFFCFKIYCSVQYFASCSEHWPLPLTAVLQVLLEESTQRVPAALHGLAVFVDTLRLLVEAQQSVNAPSVSPQHSLPAQPKEDSGVLSTATPVEEDQQVATLAQSADDAGAAAMTSAEAKRPTEAAPSTGIAVDALLSHLNKSVCVTLTFEIVISAVRHHQLHAFTSLAQLLRFRQCTICRSLRQCVISSL